MPNTATLGELTKMSLIWASVKLAMSEDIKPVLEIQREDDAGGRDHLRGDLPGVSPAHGGPANACARRPAERCCHAGRGHRRRTHCRCAGRDQTVRPG